MADTRCANPEYQLDVDILMVEYVVYKAIQAQLMLLNFLSVTQSSLTNGALDSMVQCAQDALRLAEIYDSMWCSQNYCSVTNRAVLIGAFKRNHGFDHLREIVRLDGYLLQFLVLLNMWLQSRREPVQGQLPRMARDMQRRLEYDEYINRFFRRFWLNKREQRSDAEALEVATLPRRQNSQICLADHLLPRFMHLSYQMRSHDAEPSVVWMKLASIFMLHAAVEILDTPDLFQKGLDAAQMALKECFAWGYVERPRFENNQQIVQLLVAQIEGQTAEMSRLSVAECEEHIQKTALLEDRVWDMLYDEGSTAGQSDDANVPQSSGEISSWTRIRKETLDVVLTTLDTMQEEGDAHRHRPIEWMRNQYPLSNFLVEIAKFVHLHWTELHLSEREGKPTLVQIEEGGLAGLSAEEFEAFIHRASIKEEQWFGITIGS